MIGVGVTESDARRDEVILGGAEWDGMGSCGVGWGGAGWDGAVRGGIGRCGVGRGEAVWGGMWWDGAVGVGGMC